MMHGTTNIKDDEMLLQYYFQFIIQNYSSIFRFKATNKLIVFIQLLIINRHKFSCDEMKVLCYITAQERG